MPLSDRRAHVAAGPRTSRGARAWRRVNTARADAHHEPCLLRADRARKQNKIKNKRREEGAVGNTATRLEYNCARVGIHESQVRLGQNKCSIYTPPSLRTSRAVAPRTLGSTYRVQFGRGSVGGKSSAVDGLFMYAYSCCFLFFPPSVVLLSSHAHIPSLPRVHVGIPLFPSVT